MSTFIQPNSLKIRRILNLLGFGFSMLVLMLSAHDPVFSQSGNLEQGRNGSAASPVSPVPFGNGNSGSSNSHYLEGMSSPYRLHITGLTAGPHYIELEYDIRKSNLNAMDYLTSYQRLEPHTQFNHTAEVIDPLIGLPGISSTPVTFPIPTPIVNKTVSCTGLPQPSTDFNSLPASERMMTMFGGVSIDSIKYVPDGSGNYSDLNANSSVAVLRVDFTTTNSEVVFAWGGHLASADVWCPGKSASGISGSSYHIRVSSIDGSSMGQDMSLSASAVIPIPPCDINGPDTVCANTNLTYTKDPFIDYTYTWSITNNSSGAYIIGSNIGSTIDINSGNTAGSYTIELTMSGPDYTGTCTQVVHVDQITLSSTVTDYSCSTSQGQVDILVSGGNTPYTFSWSNGATTEDLTNVSAGNYSVTVTGANGCTATTSVTVNSNSSITLSLTKTDVNCNGGTNGTLTGNIGGGTAPYSFLWSNGATTSSISGLPYGTYTLTVTDSNGCIRTLSNTVSQPPVLAVTPNSVQNVSCNGQSDGNIILGVTGGTQPYSYLWSTGSVSQDLGNVIAGTYTVTVTDNNGCVQSMTQTITQPIVLTNNTDSIYDISCFGLSDGAIYITPSGGTAPYNYLWSNGVSTQDLTGVNAGTYTVTVSDANGCNTTSTVVLSQPAAALTSSNVVNSNVSCFGGSNGSATANPTGGTLPYSYQWSNGSVNQVLSNVSSGVYTVTVTDANGCTYQNSVNISQPASPVGITANSVIDALCFGTPSGNIDITATGGTTPYSYSWSNGQTTQDILGIPTGTYTVTVTDGNGCTTTASYPISQPSAAINASTTVTGNISCFSGNDGAIDLTVTGGTTPYTYLWSTGANTQDVSSLSAGSYTVTITDANGCTYSISEVITQPAGALATNIAISPPVSCFGGSDGIVDITVSGGTAPYTYIWSNGATTQDITGLPAGVYTVTITDVNGCNATLSTTITQPPSPLMGSAVISQDVSCFAGNDGIVDLTVTGGTPPYTYLWNNGFVSQDLSNMPAGTYNVTITDSKGCVTNASATISQPAAALNANATATQMVSCNSGSNGSINLGVSGGTAPYSYSWSNGATSQNISGLTSALYSVTVTDANGCISQDTITIVQPVSPLSIVTASTQNVNCFGDNTGFINITPNGGTNPYSYSWSNGSTTEDINTLTAGSYTVTITDANGCITSGTWLVSQPLAPLASTAVADPDVYCYGDSTGSANLTVTGGTTPYSYNWSNGSTTQDIFGLTAGTYTVTITDALGCTDVRSVTINQPSNPLSATIPSPVHVLCHGDSTGSIDLLMSGGTTPYSYNWSNGATTQDLTSLYAGTYTVTVTDSLGCITNSVVNITEPAAALTAALDSVIDVLCFGNSTGAINITTAGGTSPYSYTWSNGSTTQDINGLAAGTYTSTITDANGCITQLTTTVSQPAAPLAVAPSTIQNVLCYGGNTGAVHVSVSGGTGPYSFNWSNGSTTHDITFLPAGTYTVTVTDVNGCTETLTSTVTEPAAPLSGSTMVTSNISCFAGNNGSIDLTVSGGTGPYTFLWSNGTVTEDISGLAAGIYTVTVTDNNNCTIMITDSIVQPAGALALTLNVDQNVSCNAGADGSISLIVNGGTAPYSYTWSNGATTQNITNVPTGVYTVTVTDANGCNSSQSIGVTQPSVALNSSVSNLVNVLCHGDSSGILDIYVIGGTLPYSFNWSSGATTEDITGIGSGIYTVTITDANGCTSTLSDTITQPAAPLQDTLMHVVHVFCAGDQSGSLEIFVDGGTSPYSYQWSNGTSTSLNDSLAAGIYTVTVTDANGCSIIVTDTVIGFAAISSTITMNPVLCYGDNTGSVITNITGGTAPYSYSWNTGDTTIALNNVQAGVYSVTITDVNGCTTTGTATVTEPQAPLAISGTPYDADCLGGTGGGVNIMVTGGTPGYSYLWSNGDTTQSLSGVLAGTFSLIVTDDNGCIDSAQYVVNNNSTLNVNASALDFCVGGSTTLISDSIPGAQYQWYYNGSPLMGANNMTFNTPAGGYYYIEVTTACGVFISDSVQIVVHTLSNISVSNPQFICPPESASLVATGGISYNWSPSTNINFTNIPNPTVYPTESTIYTVVITNEFGCTTELSVPVSVICDSLLVPTGFSPNDDGVNDGYVIDDIQSYDGNKLWIYNRWGNLVYKAENYANEWDGVSNVKGMYFGRKVPSGTYFYILDLNEGSRPRSGYLIIKH